MADFSRLTPDQTRVARRLLIIPGWLMAGSRYPVHFALNHPIRSSLLAYVAMGEPGAPERLQFNQPIDNYFTKGQPTYKTGIGAAQGEGFSTFESLVPNVRLAKGLIHPAASKSYPEDASRLGRLKREVGVIPIKVSAGNQSLLTRRIASLKLEAHEAGAPTPDPRVLEDLEWKTKLDHAISDLGEQPSSHDLATTTAAIFDQRFPGRNLAARVARIRTEGQAQRFYEAIRPRLYPGVLAVSPAARSHPRSQARSDSGGSITTPSRSIAPVELIPKALIIGLFTPMQPGSLDRERVNRIWNEISARHDYRQFNITPDAAQFLGASADDALVLQPPLVQIRSSARLGLQNAADEAGVALKAVAKHLSITQFFNLGIKHVYHSPAPDKDALSFVLRRLLGKEEGGDLGALERGGRFWAGLKYGADAPDESSYTLVIEPFLADNQYLFIDLDAQFPGPVDLDRVTERAREAEDYADQAMRQYLEGADYSAGGN